MRQLTKMILIAFFATVSLSGIGQDVLKVENGASITVQSGAEITVQGNITLDNGSTLVNNGTIRLKENGASAANWTDNTASGYNYGSGKVIFNGTTGHTVISKNTFERIDVDASGHVTLSSDINCNKWYLVNGRVNTGSYYAIALSTTQAAVEADPANTNFASSWFNGNLRRYLATNSVNNYVFPVGNATNVKRAVLDNLTASPLNNLSYINASFGAKPGTDAGLIATENGQAYISVNSGGVWYLTPNAAPTSGAYDLLLYFNGFSGLNDNSFAILKRDNSSSNAADWVSPTGSSLPANGSPGRLVASGYARRNGIQTFSQFGIGQFGNALPVTLLDFDARRLTKIKVLVAWQTTTEINNKGFEIERRLDTEQMFTSIGFAPTLAPNGNSVSRIDYSFTDANGYAGISYYRLKQVDQDDRFVFTHIKAVKGMGETQVSVLLYPNPNHGQFTIRLDGVNRSYDALITDMNGKTIRQVRLGNSNEVMISGLSAGAYIIRIPDVFGAGESFAEKVLVIK